MKRISVIIPFYNNKREDIIECINSVLSQDIDGLELIIVNDGSGPEGAETIHEIEKIYSSLTVISKDNGGPASARNLGVKHATGQYITFLDADDMLLDGSLKKMLMETETGADLIIGGVSPDRSIMLNVKKDDHDRETVKRILFDLQEGSSDLKSRLIALTPESDCPGGYIGRGPVSRLIKRELAAAVPFNEDLSVGEDIVWNLSLLDRCKKVLMCFEVWYFYRENHQSITRKVDPEISLKIQKQLLELTKHVDMDDLKQYKAVVDHIYESIYMVYDNCLNKKSGIPLKKRREIKNMIYKEYPWVQAKDKKYFRMSDRNKKIAWLFYRTRQMSVFCRLRH